MNLADAMARARVLDIDLQKQLRPLMEQMVPLPGIYDPDFIAANQGARANNLIKGSKREQMEQVIQDIRFGSNAFGLYANRLRQLACILCQLFHINSKFYVGASIYKRCTFDSILYLCLMLGSSRKRPR